MLPHIASDLLQKLKQGEAPTLHSSRYFLFEPSHTIKPPGMEAYCQSLLREGFVPVLGAYYGGDDEP